MLQTMGTILLSLVLAKLISDVDEFKNRQTIVKRIIDHFVSKRDPIFGDIQSSKSIECDRDGKHVSIRLKLILAINREVLSDAVDRIIEESEKVEKVEM